MFVTTTEPAGSRASYDPSHVTPHERAAEALDGLRRIMHMNPAVIAATEQMFRMPLLHAIICAEQAQGNDPRGSFKERYPSQYDVLALYFVDAIQRGCTADDVIENTLRPELAKLGIKLPR